MGIINSFFGEKKDVSLEEQVFNMIKHLSTHLEGIIHDHNMNNKNLEDFTELVKKVKQHNETLNGILSILNSNHNNTISFAKKEVINKLKETKLQSTSVLYKPSDKLFDRMNKDLNNKRIELEKLVNTINVILSQSK